MKAEIHCHIEGAAPPALALQQARKYGVDASTFLSDGRYLWSDFSEFLVCYDRVAALFRTDADYALLTETYLTELAAANTIYSEIIVSPDHGDRIGLGADAYLSGISEGIHNARDKTGIEARIIVTGERHFGPDSVIAAADYAARSSNPLVTGFNMAGEERMGRVADYARAFDIAGLGTVLEVCPGSNVALQVYPDFDHHPLRRLKEAGVRVCLNSDDPPFFRTSLEREYRIAAEVMGFSEAEINGMTRTAVEAAFVDEDTRSRLLARLDGAAALSPNQANSA